MITDDPNATPPLPPPSDDPEAQRRERLLAFRLGAIDDPEEEQLIRGRLESDPDWQRADREAAAMLKGLAEDGQESSEVPVDLGLRTVRRLAAPEANPEPQTKPAAAVQPAPRFFFTPRLAAAIFLCCALPVLWAALHGFGALKGTPALRWQPESALAAGGSFVPDVEVRDSVTGDAWDGVRLAGFLEPLDAPAGLRQPLALGERTTGAAGRPDGEPWLVPADLQTGKYRLRIDALDGGSVIDSVAHDVSVARAALLALAPDRPQARPGETLRARVLVVEGTAQRPAANREVVLELVDPAGNRLLRQTRRTSIYGLAWAEFPIDAEAPEGGYLLRAQAGDLHAQRTVPVLQYRLPPFRVEVEPEQPWFRARTALKGAVTARTFDGEPVGGAKGVLRVTALDGTVLQTINLRLDAQGRAAFAARPPQDGEAGLAVRPVRLEAELSDPAERSATGEKIVNISREPFVVSVVPEAGDLVQGVPNRVYVVVRSPDGHPVRAHLRVAPSEAIGSEWSEYETDAAGVAELEMKNPRAPAETVALRARPVDADAKSGTRELYFSLPVRSDLPLKPGDTRPSGKLLLRCDQAVVQAGGKLKFSLHSWYDAGAVSVALRGDGRTLAAATVQLERGRAAGELTVPENASGILSVEARMPYYRYEWLDRRVVAVAGNAALKVAAAAANPRYRPGETAILDFHVTDAAGQGVPAAVSVVALDESLLAVAGPHPGLAQALQAAGVEVFRTPGVPLDLAGFGVAAGSSPAARAAAGAAQPPTAEGARAYLAALANSGKLELARARRIEELFLKPASGPELQERAALIDVLKREGLWEDLRGLEGLDREPARAGTVDHGPELLARATQAQRVARQRALEWGLAAAIAGLALLGLLLAFGTGTERPGDALRIVENAVPVFTFGTALLGIVAFAFLDNRNPAVLPCALVVTLIGSHALLLWRAGQLRAKVGGSALFVLTMVIDGVLLCCTMGMLAYGVDSGYAVLALVAAFVGGILQAINWSATAQFARAIGLTVAGVLTMVFVAGLLSLFIVAGGAKDYSFNSMTSSADEKAPAQGFVRESASPPVVPVRPSAGAASGHKSDPVAIAQAQVDAVLDPYASQELHFGITPSEQIFPRLRYDFRETMLFEPQLVCDEQGKASIEFPVADSLTTWRVQADCVGMGGGIGFGTAKLVVTQPFSIDATLPSDVTAGDRLRVPAVVQNFTGVSGTVEVTLDVEGDGVKIEGPATQSVPVAAKSVASVEFAVFFERPGAATLRLTARAAGQADAAERLLPVRPAGEPVGFAAGGVFAGNGELLVAVPEYAYPESLGATLSIHRGPLTQMIDGLERMLQEPHGCFEQTSSTNYPNIMILRYLKAHGLQDAALERRTRDYLARGYQRLLGFEVSGGGFSLYGRSPASPWLTAYGLMQFRDLDAVQPVDPALLARTRDWLLRQRGADGRFTLDRPVHTELWANGANASDVRDLPSTAYAVLALGADAPQESVQFIARNARAAERDAYLCALCALALQPHDPDAAAALAGKLRALAKTEKVGEQEHLSLPAQQTLSWGYGNAATTEATALGVLALLKTGTDVDLAVKLLNHLQRSASSGGAWGSTHATVLALKALEQASSIQAPAGGSRVVVEVNGQPLPALELPEQESAEAPSARLKLKPGANRLLVKVAGGPATLRVDGRAFVPVKAGAPDPAAELWTRVVYDRTKLARGETVRGTLVLKAKTRKAEVPMAEWGVPAGFAPVAADLDALVNKGELARWERSGRTVRLYLPDLEAGKVVRLPVRFRADARGTLQAAPGRVYEYYRRNESVALAPVTFEVE